MNVFSGEWRGRGDRMFAESSVIETAMQSRIWSIRPAYRELVRQHRPETDFEPRCRSGARETGRACRELELSPVYLRRAVSDDITHRV